ncbi:hypothetical protein ACVVIH_12350 [Chryseobacterium arthrosphaerae]|uniref:hypothetical protein n=1 Tax=Chryseobacterium TaxID=59732 RepID=UPI001BAFB54E|nr:hypothetical protein [Chryseobacterium arthrosphaerae]QUY54594.1 hypothetical protein I2F65_17145 [Chryseobacterium arthrosphaerae]
MRIQEIVNKKTGEKLIIFGGEDFENVHPQQHYYEACLMKGMILSVPDEISGRKKPTEEGKKALLETSKICKEYIASFNNIKVPQSLKDLLKTTKKKEQTKALNGLVITPDILMAFLFFAGDQGYTLSQYSSEFQTTAIEGKKLPLAYMKSEDGKIKKLGKTELTDGELKMALEQRTVKVAKFIEKGDEWHCFFITYDSIGGKENWQDGQPHFHYISNLFGISREDVVNQIKSKKYKLGNLPHLKLTEYGEQPK